jgi:Alpha/beta hydrolase domain
VAAPRRGPFERVTGRAYDEVDPNSSENSIIQDIALAPRNQRGMVAYTTDIDILRPADPTKSNNILLLNVINRGNKGALPLFNADVPPSPADNKAERERTGDPRPSLEERYPTKEVYVAAVRKAPGSLVADRLLLPEDAARPIAEADTKGIRTSP